MKKQGAKGLPIYKGAAVTYGGLAIIIVGEAVAIIAQAYFIARAIALLFSRVAFTEVVPFIGGFVLAFVLRYVLVQIEAMIANRYAKNSAHFLRRELLARFFSQQS